MNTSADEDAANNPAQGRSAGGARRSITLLDNRVDSAALFAGAREIIITHGSETYRLRVTTLNKLILTK